MKDNLLVTIVMTDNELRITLLIHYRWKNTEISLKSSFLQYEEAKEDLQHENMF